MADGTDERDTDWESRLTPEQYRIMRKHGTERAFTGAYWDFKAKGTYLCAACGTPLFASDTKYDSGTGWPSFWAPLAPDAVATDTDFKLLIPRIEVHCRRCEGHLGHVFDDGPRPTGKRYCLNSASLRFEPAAGAEGAGAAPDESGR